MIAKVALSRFLAPLRPQDERTSVDDWLDDDWFRVMIRGRLRPIVPLFGAKRALALHDLHHVLTGYGTDLQGELGLAAWELASGGCAGSLAFWVDRVFAVLLGCVLFPRQVLRALRTGRGCRNLFGVERDRALAIDLTRLARWTRTSGRLATNR